MKKKAPLFIALMSLLLSLFLSELALRIWLPVCPVNYRYQPDIGISLQPNQKVRCASWEYDHTVETNDAGFNDSPRETKKGSGVFRILVLGDSFVEALQVQRPRNLTSQLESLIKTQSSKPTIEVLNFGVSGNGVAQYLRLLEAKGLAYKPNLIIFAITMGNDFRDSHFQLKKNLFSRYYTLEGDNLVLLPPAVTVSEPLGAKNLAKKVRLFELLRRLLRGTLLEKWLSRVGLMSYSANLLPTRSGVLPLPIDWGIYRKDRAKVWEEATTLIQKELSTTAKLSQIAGAKFLVVFIPAVASVENRWSEALTEYGFPFDSKDWDFEKPRTNLLQYCQSHNISCLDLTPGFRAHFRQKGKSHSFEQDGHWNNSGHALAAKLIAKFAREQKLVPSSHSDS